MSDLIRAEHLAKQYESVAALQNVSFRLEAGKSLVIVGPSGCGKTTLINLLAGLDAPTAGNVWVNGTDLSTLSQEERAQFRREHIGIVFQQFHLIPYLSAVENVMLAQYLHSLPDREEALAALETVGLRSRADHRPPELSGGEQQRVAIARAVANDPLLLLADEPTGNLDADNEQTIMNLFARLNEDGKTVVLVTHNRELTRTTDRLLELKYGEITRAATAF